MSEWSFVVAAYALTYVTLAIYVLYLRGRTRKAEQELETTVAGEDLQ